MKQTTIRELKHAASHVLGMVEAGETVEIFRRRKSVAILSPSTAEKPVAMPDFAARLRTIYGDVVLKTTGTQVVNDARGDR
jgi:antitoxin (DNA-binding transcriptional repressor) of toxin-antitoxin stability system